MSAEDEAALEFERQLMGRGGLCVDWRAQRRAMQLMALGFSSEEIAEKVGVVPGTVTRWARDAGGNPRDQARALREEAAGRSADIYARSAQIIREHGGTMSTASFAAAAGLTQPGAGGRLRKAASLGLVVKVQHNTWSLPEAE